MEQSPEAHQILSNSLRAEYQARAVRVGIQEPKVVGHLMEMVDRHAEEINAARNIDLSEALDTPMSRADVIGIAGGVLVGFFSGFEEATNPIKQAVNTGKITAQAALVHGRLREIFTADKDLYPSDDWEKIQEATRQMFPTLEEARKQASQELDRERTS